MIVTHILDIPYDQDRINLVYLKSIVFNAGIEALRRIGTISNRLTKVSSLGIKNDILTMLAREQIID